VNVVETSLQGCLLIEPKVFRDDRGLFLEVYRKDAYAVAGMEADFVQDNHSRSAKGVLRGIHFQDMSAPMAKLVRCTAGRIFDVAVDLRTGSPQFGRWFGVELSADNMKQLYVPVGFGHAFLALSETADLQYKCSAYWAPAAERVLAWNDPELAIDWPVRQPILSPRDQKGESLKEYRERPAFTYPLPDPPRKGEGIAYPLPDPPNASNARIARSARLAWAGGPDKGEGKEDPLPDPPHKGEGNREGR